MLMIRLMPRLFLLMLSELRYSDAALMICFAQAWFRHR